MVSKITLLADDLWLNHISEQMLPFVEQGEILQVLERTEVEVCEDCQEYQTEDGEVIMEVFKCYYQQEYCLNCCGCEDHQGEKWY